MAVCDITKGKILLTCKDSIGGLKNIYFANYGDYDIQTTNPYGSSVNDNFMITDLGDLSEVFQYRLKNTGNTFQQDIETSVDNGVVVYKPTLTVNLTKVNEDMELQVYKMAIGNPLIFVETHSGKIFLCGLDNGMELSGNSQVAGEMNGFNGYQLTFTGEERYPVHYLDKNTPEALKELVSESNMDVDPPKPKV